MKAVLKNGVIYPQEPVPAEWSEGTELEVEKATAADAGSEGDALERWYAELEAACSQMDPEDDRVLKAALLEVRQQEKEWARRRVALGE